MLACGHGQTVYQMGFIATCNMLDAVIALLKGEAIDETNHTLYSIEEVRKTFRSVESGASRVSELTLLSSAVQRKNLESFMALRNASQCGDEELARLSSIIAGALEKYQTARACYECPGALFASEGDKTASLEFLEHLRFRAQRRAFQLP